MRFLVFGSTALLIVLSLLLFDDMNTGLPIVGLVVWAAVAIAGLLLVLRMRGRKRRIARPRPRRSRLLTRIAARRAPKPLLLPRR